MLCGDRGEVTRGQGKYSVVRGRLTEYCPRQCGWSLPRVGGRGSHQSGVPDSVAGDLAEVDEGQEREQSQQGQRHVRAEAGEGRPQHQPHVYEQPLLEPGMGQGGVWLGARGGGLFSLTSRPSQKWGTASHLLKERPTCLGTQNTRVGPGSCHPDSLLPAAALCTPAMMVGTPGGCHLCKP